MNWLLCLAELAFGIPGESMKENAIMERGLQRLSNATAQWNTFGPKISGVQSTTTRNRSPMIFYLEYPPATRRRQDQVLRMQLKRIGCQSTSQLHSRMTTYVIGKASSSYCHQGSPILMTLMWLWSPKG